MLRGGGGVVCCKVEVVLSCQKDEHNTHNRKYNAGHFTRVGTK